MKISWNERLKLEELTFTSILSSIKYGKSGLMTILHVYIRKNKLISEKKPTTCVSGSNRQTLQNKFYIRFHNSLL